MLSLIMLSWERVENVINNIRQYSTYKIIDEIIVFNNNYKYRLPNLNSDKVIVIESSKDIGLFTRFVAAGIASNECIMHCDDDLIVPEGTVNELYKQWNLNPMLCHGTQGRVINEEYNMKNVYGRVHIVLTRCMLTSRTNCLLALQFSVLFKDIICEPKGNGEDIILSFISISKSGELNICHKLPYNDFQENFEEGDKLIAISKRWEKHVEHRSNVVKRCRNLLGEDNILLKSLDNSNY